MQKNNVTNQQNAPKPEWRTPTLRTMRTSDAENGGTTNPDANNQS